MESVLALAVLVVLALPVLLVVALVVASRSRARIAELETAVSRVDGRLGELAAQVQKLRASAAPTPVPDVVVARTPAAPPPPSPAAAPKPIPVPPRVEAPPAPPA